jgi:hypothetical protein
MFAAIAGIRWFRGSVLGKGRQRRAILMPKWYMQISKLLIPEDIS